MYTTEYLTDIKINSGEQKVLVEYNKANEGIAINIKINAEANFRKQFTDQHLTNPLLKRYLFLLFL